MLVLLIGIIIAIIALYLIIIVYQHLLLRKVRLVEEKNKNIQGQSLERALNDAGKLKLTGRSLKEFKGYRNSYKKIHSQLFDVVDSLIQNIERDSRSLNFVKTHKEYQKADRVVNKITVSIKDIKKGLRQLQDLNKLQKRSASDLALKYRKIHKELLTKHYIYGPSANKISAYLERVEKTFHHFLKLYRTGDHDSAEQILNHLNTKTDYLDFLMKEAPILYKKLATIYPKQLNEIKYGHRYMVQSGYQFPEENMNGAIQYVQDKVKKTIKGLGDLKLNQAKASCHQIDNMIDQLYSSMSREIKAKHRVNQYSDVITDYIAHDQKQNYALMSELMRLSKNYDLNHNEIKTTKQLREKLSHLDAVQHKDLDKMAENSVIYSEVLSHQKRAADKLSQIESQQLQINRSVYNLNKEEASAKDNVQKFGLDLHNIRRKVERLNLPGLPKSYVNYYNLVFKELKALSDKINQVKISMDDINKRLMTIRTDMGTLRKKTDHLVNDASLAEQMMQYSNRYSNTNKNVANASSRAQILFDKEYRYKDSLDLISSVIDQIDPGVSSRIKKQYYRKLDSKKD